MTSGASHSAARTLAEPWQPTRRQAAIIMALVGFLYVFAVSNHWWIDTDSALYLSVGRSLAQGEGFVHNVGQSPGGVSPGLPLLVAASYRLFGEAFWPLNLAMALAGIGAAVLTYRLVRLYRRPRRTALNVFLLTGLSSILFELSRDIATDVPGLFLFMAGLFCLLRFTRGQGWLWLTAGLALLLAAIAFRLPLVPLAPILVAALAFEKGRLPRRQQLWGTVVMYLVVIGVAVGVLAALSVVGLNASGGSYLQSMTRRFIDIEKLPGYIARAVGEIPSNIFQLLAAQKLPQIGAAQGAWQVLLYGLAIAFGWGVVLLVLVGWWRAVRQGRALVSFSALGYLLFLVLAWNAPAVRYIFVLLPLVAWFMVEGAETLGRSVILRRRSERAVQTWVSILVVLLVAANVPKVVREGLYKSHHPDFVHLVKGGRLAKWQPLGDFFKQQKLADNEVVLTPSASEIHFLSGGLRTVEFGEAQADSWGYWKIVKNSFSGRKVRFVVLSKQRRPTDLHQEVYDLNAAACPLVFQTADFEVLECPAGWELIIPDYPAGKLKEKGLPVPSFPEGVR